MKILLTGSRGGIGSAIKESLREHEITEVNHSDMTTSKEGKLLVFLENPPSPFDWLVFSHGFIGESNVGESFLANAISQIMLTSMLIEQIKQGVIFISSTAALTANSRFPIYSASKAALNTYSVAMSKAHPELKFYAICPGPTNTKMWRSLGLPGEAQEPSEVAKVVERAMEGEWLSGSVISIRNGTALCQ